MHDVQYIRNFAIFARCVIGGVGLLFLFNNTKQQTSTTRNKGIIQTFKFEGTETVVYLVHYKAGRNA